MKCIVFVAALLLLSCGNPPKKSSPIQNGNCGNGQLDPGEACDPAIATGEGVCPTAATCNAMGCGASYSGNPASCDAQCAAPTCGDDDSCCPSGCDSTNDPQCTNTCGNGAVEEGETCDGDCPATCDDRNACTIDAFTGAAETCNIACTYENVTICADDDGCCPGTCSFENDNDCSALCGNGTIDPDETCDGDCPTQCNDNNVCTADLMTGSASNCNIACSFSDISTCAAGDGCCPAGCTAANDADCDATCGNDVLEPGETCDGDCPVTCDDMDACTTQTQAGAANTCDIVCSYQAVVACVDSDGCCPAACDWTTDNDCPCTPMTCGQQGIQCGPATDGCGNALQCPNCSGNQICDNGTCIANPTGQVGDRCTVDSQCASNDCITQAYAGWDQGYCTQFCDANTACPSGSFCDLTFNACIDSCSGNCGRAELQCYNRHGDGFGCYPYGGGNSAVGNSCSKWGDCSGGFDGRCMRGTAFKNGYCTEQCDTNNPCPFGSDCENGYCYDNCTADANCRAGGGYACSDLDNDGQKVCVSSGTGNGQIGGPCLGVWDCAGGLTAECGAEGSGFPGGYCSQSCDGLFSLCPTGSECNELFGGYCVDSCTNNFDCRGGYSCQSVGGAAVDACWPI